MISLSLALGDNNMSCSHHTFVELSDRAHCHPTFSSISNHTAIRSASDRSVLAFIGCQGWLIATLDNDVLLEGVGATDGRVKGINSYMAELGGNIATFTILNIIRCVYNFSPISIEHVCDNQSEITATRKHDTSSMFDKTKPDDDVIIVARCVIFELQLHSTAKYFWVISHSEKRGPQYSQQ
jgi:hypothetical protein